VADDFQDLKAGDLRQRAALGFLRLRSQPRLIGAKRRSLEDVQQSLAAADSVAQLGLQCGIVGAELRRRQVASRLPLLVPFDQLVD
jgi:hypothetical protein